MQDARGRVAIPAGAVVYGTVTAVKHATSPSNAGTLTLAVSGVTVRGKSYPIDASIDAIATERQGQGVTGGDVQVAVARPQAIVARSASSRIASGAAAGHGRGDERRRRRILGGVAAGLSQLLTDTV